MPLTDNAKISMIPAKWSGYFYQDTLMWMCAAEYEIAESEGVIRINGIAYRIAERCDLGNGRTAIDLKGK